MRVILVSGVLSGALLCTSPATAQTPWTGPAGGGLLSVEEAHIVPPRHGACGLSFDNYDRDPFGLDITDLALSCRIGIVRHVEFAATYQIARGVVVPGDPPIPPPPMDIFVASGEPPQAPYRVMYMPMPFLPRSSSSITEMRDGEYAMGFRVLVRHQHGAAPSIAIGARAIMTSSNALEDLQKGSGAGSTDVRIHGAATWDFGRFRTSVNLGYTHYGALGHRDRFITADASNAPKAERPGLLHTGIGARYRLANRLWLIGEFGGWRPIGYHTPTLEFNGSSDAIAGFQTTRGRFTLTAGVRKHLGAPRSGVFKPTGPLGGGVLLTDVAMHDRLRYLDAIGFPDPAVRRGVAVLAIGVPPHVPLPEGAALIPTTFTTNTRGNIGSVVSLSVSF